MKILALTRYERLGASSRMRTYQYLPALAHAGIDVTVSALFPDSYVRDLQLGKKDSLVVLTAYAKRISALLGLKKYEVVWIEKEVLPWLPAVFERTFLPRNIPYVLDYDDAVFHYYDCHPKSFVRTLLNKKIPTLMRDSSVVFAGNEYIADYARSAGASTVEVMPTVIDIARYPLTMPRCISDGMPTVGWIGQRSTAAFLQPLAPIFRELMEDRLTRFLAVGIDAAALGLPMHSVPWSESTEVRSIRSFDVGIMPLLDGPFERGKCGYKLIQYMACSLPVVASPVGVNRQIVEHGVNGYLASTPQEWAEAIRALAADPALRERMGRAGRRKVEKQFSLQVNVRRIVELLRNAAGKPFN